MGETPDEPQAEIVDVEGDPRAWSDEELSAAFGSRHGQAQEARRSRGRIAIGIAGVVLFAGLVGLAGVDLLGGPASRVRPTAGLTSAPPASAQPAPLPASTAAGLPVIGVGAANTEDFVALPIDTELAVRGWYTASRSVAQCQFSAEPAGTCISAWTAVFLSNPDTVYRPDGIVLPVQGSTTVLHPVFVPPVPEPSLRSSVTAGAPVEVIPPSPLILVGHFHDDRVPTDCPSRRAQAGLCDPAFVVDAVADISGSNLGGSTTTILPTQLAPETVTGLLGGHLQPGAVVLSFGPVSWLADPAAVSVPETSPDGPPQDGRSVWLVRGYLPQATGPDASWLAIDDVSGRIWGPMASAGGSGPPLDGFPITIDGLPVQTVAKLLPRAPTIGLVAVAGYLSNDRAPEGCPLAPTTIKTGGCSDTQLVLIDQPGSILQANDATFQYAVALSPGVPSILPLVRPGTTAPDPWANLAGLEARVEPRRVILIGQFADPRSPACAPRPGGGSAGCDVSFVVDQVGWIDGVAQGPSIWGPSVLAIHAAQQVVRAFTPALASFTIVSVTGTLPADSVRLTGIAAPAVRSGPIWVVRYAGISVGGRPTSGWVILDDQTLRVIAHGLNE